MTCFRPTVLVFAALIGCPLGASAQSQPTEPWWPHPRWGAGDQAGGSNWITPAKVLEALSLVRTGRIYELGHVYERAMPLFGQRTFSLVVPTTSGPSGANGLLANEEFVSGQLGQVGTQFDGPGHIGMRVAAPDGTSKDVYYNGVTSEEMRGPYGLRRLGVENVGSYVTRGIVVDVAGYKGVSSLPPAYEVSLADVLGALAMAGIEESGIQPGDALFFNYGWSRLWTDPARYNQVAPGIGLEVARWVVEKRAALVGSDAATTEVQRNPDDRLVFPVHQELIMKHGIFNIENMTFESLMQDRVYEFLFVFAPLRLRGATGSPGRPIGIR
jgi:kynurenine formamidase